VDKVFSRIVEVTQHPAAAASFASIMLAPGGELSFSEALSRYKTVWFLVFICFLLCVIGVIAYEECCYLMVYARCKENNVQICLMYGREDPWVRPLWGKKIKKEIPNAPYYEISPAGHCPHDEVPEV